MSGADGSKNSSLVNVTWEQFQSWQRWDEFPERSENPPMTVDMTFWYRGEKYYLDCVNHEYAILTEKWRCIASDKNFLRLLNKPIERWNEKSFHEIVAALRFVN